MAKYYKEDCNQPDWPMFVSKIPLLAWINKPRGNPGSLSSIPPWDPTGSKNSSPLNLRSRRSKFSYTDWSILNDRSVEDAIIFSGILVVWRTPQGQKVFVRVRTIIGLGGLEVFRDRLWTDVAGESSYLSSLRLLSALYMQTLNSNQNFLTKQCQK